MVETRPEESSLHKAERVNFPPARLLIAVGRWAARFINLGGLETEHGLHGESVSAIRELLQCPSDDAIAILRDLRVRKLIDLESTPDGQLNIAS